VKPFAASDLNQPPQLHEDAQLPLEREGARRRTLPVVRLWSKMRTGHPSRAPSCAPDRGRQRRNGMRHPYGTPLESRRRRS
jgi:hypothetical protein